MPRYYKRHWDEPRGDQFSHWGTSDWLFEVGPDHYPSRQIEIYENGIVIRYSELHKEDQYGGLSDQACDLAEFSNHEILREEFEEVWAAEDSYNQ